VAFFATTGVILSARLCAVALSPVIFGALTKESLKGHARPDAREIAIFAPLVVLTICSASIRRRSSTRRRRR
jgi:NADH-quinone oxidoreductase subunit M